jgi:hypothetical protein
MAEMFSGDWTVEVLWGGIWYQLLTEGASRRFIIEGALTGNGVYFVNLGPIGPPSISVSGPRWFIRIELYVGGVLGWQPDTNLKRSSVAYTLQGGLVVDISSGNWIVPTPAVPLFIPNADSAALRCRNVDPKLNPWHPLANPYDFTLPKQRRPEKPIRPPKPSVR